MRFYVEMKNRSENDDLSYFRLSCIIRGKLGEKGQNYRLTVTAACLYA